ncbi:MAG: asparagine synthase (glutamine-hydrolyzing) [Myxococcales bacterium]
MCGIAGEARFAGPPDEEAVRRMSTALAHRGPDAEGFFRDGPCALGHRRLSILDLAGGGQPMIRERVALVFNGEAYQHAELRERLRGLGHPFETRSDTEVVLRAYLEWGERFVEEVHGMFALALWDGRAQKLVLARDRLGKKPLYYALSGSGGEGAFAAASLLRDPPPEGATAAARGLVFGSELKALDAHGGVARDLDRVSLVQYLAVESVPAPRSIHAGVFKLPAAHTAVLDRAGFRLRRYWEAPVPPRFRPAGSGAADLDLDAAARRLRILLDQAVQRRLVADVPLGVFLSGGVDSTAVAVLAARHAPGVQTFSIGFAETSFDETPWSRLAAEKLGTRHAVEMLSARACLDLIPEAAQILDEPFADLSFLPALLLSRSTRRSVTVALAGDGGDELFAGYDPFLAHRPAALLAHAPSAALSGLSRAVALLPVSAANMSLGFRATQLLRGLRGPPELRHQRWLSAFLPAELRDVLHPDLAPLATDAVAYREVLADARRGEELGVAPGSVDAALRFYLSRYLADDILVKADRASMAASLELRAPFLDTAVVELAASLPFRHKLSALQTKVVLRRAVRDLVPEEILRRPKKGFGIPVAAWIRGPLRPLFEELMSERELAVSGLFQPAAVRALLDRHLRGEADLRKPLWTLFMFLLFRRRAAPVS